MWPTDELHELHALAFLLAIRISKRMDVFERLPVEIILQIFRHTGDFVGLDSLLRVSARVNAIFKANFRSLFDNILASWTIGASPEIRI